VIPDEFARGRSIAINPARTRRTTNPTSTPVSTSLRLPFLGVGVGSGGGATSYGFAAYPADGVLEGPGP